MKTNWLRLPLLVLVMILAASVTMDAQLGPGSKKKIQKEKIR